MYYIIIILLDRKKLKYIEINIYEAQNMCIEIKFSGSKNLWI